MKHSSVKTQPVDVPAANPKLGYLAHKDEYDAAYQAVVDSGWYILGQSVKAFEESFAAFIGVRHAVGVGTGTDAITLSLLAAGVESGDEVISTPLTAAFTQLAIQRAGAVSRFIDIEPETYMLDPNKLAEALTDNTKAVLPVHLYGQPADLDGIAEALKRAGRDDVMIIEDACQAHGAFYGESRVGSIGVAGAFSFYPTKNLGAFGDGGMLVTNDADIAAKAMMLRDGGQSSKYHHQLSGFNSRLDELHAKLLSVRLQYLDEDNAKRAAVATKYLAGLADCAWLTLPQVAEGRSHAWHLFVVRTSHRDALMDHLKSHNVGCGIHYPTAINQQPFIADAGLGTDCPVAEQVTSEVLSLPMYPELTDEQVDRVIEVVRSFQPE